MEKQSLQENKMGVMPVGRLVVTMSLPVVISMLVQALYNVVDSMFVSMISQEALNAVSLAFPAQNLMIGFATGSAVGVNALVSRALGAKEPERANKVAMNGLFIALCCYVLFLLFAIFGARPFFAMQTTNATIIEYGCDYLLVVCGLSFGVFGAIMMERLLTSTGRTVYTMISQGVGAVVNIVFDPIFIFVFDMGVTGAALATVLGQVVSCCISLILNIKKNHDLKFSLRSFRPEGKILGSICAIGVPSIIMVAVGSVMTYLYNIILFNYTMAATYAQNVFGIYFKLNSLIFMPIFGMNNAVVPIIAYNYGAQRRGRMLSAIKVSIALAVALMAVGTLLFMAIPGSLLKIFMQNTTAEEVEILLAIGKPALRIMAIPFTSAAVCICLSSCFQALGKGMYALILSACRQLVVLLPAAYVLARIGLREGNDVLIWFSFPIAEVAALVISLLLFARIYKKIITRVSENGLEQTA